MISQQKPPPVDIAFARKPISTIPFNGMRGTVLYSPYCRGVGEFLVFGPEIPPPHPPTVPQPPIRPRRYHRRGVRR